MTIEYMWRGSFDNGLASFSVDACGFALARAELIAGSSEMSGVTVRQFYAAVRSALRSAAVVSSGTGVDRFGVAHSTLASPFQGGLLRSVSDEAGG